MLNYETILSSYDDKLTLMQWLKKVEDALNNASAVSFKVNERGNATLTFSVVFEDGTEIETGPITLQQGESVASAAIVNGHLELTLTNGDVLDAGDLGGVSSFSIDASQHLIVHYQNGTTQDLGAIFNGNVNIAGDLAVNGNITGDSIIENMSGYSFTKVETAFTPTYAGVVKNGNKITFALSGDLQFSDSDNQTFHLCYFEFPSSVGVRLYEYTLPNNVDALYNDVAKAFSGILTFVECPYYVNKRSQSGINIYFRRTTNMTAGQKYFFRIEMTFLLSENLAS